MIEIIRTFRNQNSDLTKTILMIEIITLRYLKTKNQNNKVSYYNYASYYL